MLPPAIFNSLGKSFLLLRSQLAQTTGRKQVLGGPLENFIVGTYLKDRKKSTFCRYSCITGIIQEYMQKGSVFTKFQASNLKNQFLDRYFFRIFLKIK